MNLRCEYKRTGTGGGAPSRRVITDVEIGFIEALWRAVTSFERPGREWHRGITHSTTPTRTSKHTQLLHA